MVTEVNRNKQKNERMEMEGEKVRGRKGEKIFELKFFKDFICVNIQTPQNSKDREERT